MTWIAVVLTLIGVTQWTPIGERTPQTVLHGWFVSCPDADDGGYGEKVFVVKREGKVDGELHLGPRDEFAWFDGDLGELHLDHTDGRNRLGSAFHAADIRPKVGGRNWTMGRFHLNVVAAGGSDPECYTAAVLLERLPRPTYAP